MGRKKIKRGIILQKMVIRNHATFYIGQRGAGVSTEFCDPPAGVMRGKTWKRIKRAPEIRQEQGLGLTKKDAKNDTRFLAQGEFCNKEGPRQKGKKKMGNKREVIPEDGM